MSRSKVVVLLLTLLFFPYHAVGDTASIRAGIIFTKKETSTPIMKAAHLLQAMIQERTGLFFPCQTEGNAQDIPRIILGKIGEMPEPLPQIPSDVSVPEKAEAYAIWADRTSNGTPMVVICGRDERGVLFGAGKLLRLFHMSPGNVSLDLPFTLSSAPHYPIRGHELGYRNKSNTYDAWNMEQFEKYIRELAVFGVNTIQLVCELDHMDKEGPHMTETVWERTPKLAELLNAYGLNVWIWLPPGNRAFAESTTEETLSLCGDLFRSCPRIDAIFVPGGDPGDAHPRVLLPWVQRLATVLHESHPSAGVWLSNEDMPQEWNNYLFEFLQTERPTWLTGLVFGTWVKMSLKDMRKAVPEQYPLIQYVDITHCIQCQYPVPDWDRAFAFTLGREPINPRPKAMECIFHFTEPDTAGFIGYSDGVNDDVNKVIWAEKGWDPEAKLDTILKDYSRIFGGEEIEEPMAAGLKELESNWEGPLTHNGQIEKTLARWRHIEEKLPHAMNPTHWRLQMALFRAYYDAYIYHRLLSETQKEQEALEQLKQANIVSADVAIARAREILKNTSLSPEIQQIREKIEGLGKSLFDNIGIQMSVSKYGAANWERGAVLDALDTPLTDSPWMENQFKKVLAMTEESQKAQAIKQLLEWENPGEGGYYDDLGNPSKQPHLVQAISWKDDPGYVHSPQNEYIEIVGRENWRRSWLDQAQTLYGTPLKVHFDGLQPDKLYTLRVVYTGRFRPTMRLLANGVYEIHGALSQPQQPDPLEFPIPKSCTAGGSLDLEWLLVEGRGCQVAEIWLIPSQSSSP